MEEIVQELQKISEILLQNQTPAWLTYLSSLGPLILTGISVFIACGQHKQNQNLQKQIANRDSSNLLRQNVLEVYNAYFNGLRVVDQGNITWRILNSQNGRLRALLEFYCLQFVSIIKIPNMCKRLMNGQNSKTSNR